MELPCLTNYEHRYGGRYAGLYYLNLSANQLTGEIPEEIGNLSHWLFFLSLHSNQLSGEIPGSFCNLNQLHWSADSSGIEYSFIYNNNLCPPPPYCIEEYVGIQNTSECEYCIENPTDPLCND